MPLVAFDGSGRSTYVTHESKHPSRQLESDQTKLYVGGSESNRFYDAAFGRAKRRFHFNAVSQGKREIRLPESTGLNITSEEMEASGSPVSPTTEMLGPPVAAVFMLEPRPPCREAALRTIPGYAGHSPRSREKFGQASGSVSLRSAIEESAADDIEKSLGLQQSPRKPFKYSPIPPDILKLGYSGHRPRHRTHRWAQPLSSGQTGEEIFVRTGPQIP
eukprot:TRINITY_DN7343_c0_g1_i1.p1 TRINITY_DN7343_c0_g1~~TRINITY_DN7343_c0_g1_i1.p1  ORF type:complete len:236 (+),score=24.26 TRINITY_DN7343_c0_g1_i1:56-709(+)